jgi:CBS domain-containing protein
MSADAPLISAAANIETAKAFLSGQKSNSWPTGDDKTVRGLITEHAIETADPSSLVRDLIKPDTYPYVHPDHPLGFALERMRNANVDVLPVVSRANIRELCGVITQKQILREYGV